MRTTLTIFTLFGLSTFGVGCGGAPADEVVCQGGITCALETDEADPALRTLHVGVAPSRRASTVRVLVGDRTLAHLRLAPGEVEGSLPLSIEGQAAVRVLLDDNEDDTPLAPHIGPQPGR